MTDSRLATFQRLRKRQADEVGFVPEASPLNAISEDGESENGIEVIGETLLEDGVEVTGEIIHQGQDRIDDYKHHNVFYRRWTPGEIMTLRRAVCFYGESTASAWEATQKLMNKEARSEEQKGSWSMLVLRYRWAVEASSLSAEVDKDRRLLRRLVFKHGVETSDKEGYWDWYHRALKEKYPGSFRVPEGQDPGQLLRDTWITMEQPKIVQTRPFPWLEHEEYLA